MISYIERYVRLRDNFRDAHTKFGDAPISVYFCHCDHELGERESVTQVWKTPCELIGVFGIPIISPNDVSNFEDRLLPEAHKRLMAEATMRSPTRAQRSCVAFVPVSDGAKRDLESAAAIEFKRLADEAGRDLPRSVRSVIPWGFEPETYVGRWLTLMFWHTVPDARTLLRLNHLASGWDDLSFSPFDESADVIDDCQLTTQAPLLATAEGQWPVWAGKVPAATVADRAPDDGPITNGFRYRGESYTGLTGNGWRLVEHLWNSRGIDTSYEELATKVWRDIGLTGSDVEAKFRSPQSVANRFFVRNGLPLKVRGGPQPYLEVLPE